MRDRRFLLTAAASIMLLLFCVLASIACGSKSVGFPTVIRSLFHLGEETFENNVVQARIPRTVFGILAGASLSVSGALMQAVTRNPIADPSILGVNTGASLFVVCGIAFFHISKGSQYIWLAFAGAAATAILVYGLASIGGNGATPIKLALAGASKQSGNGSVSLLADRKYWRSKLDRYPLACSIFCDWICRQHLHGSSAKHIGTWG